MGTHRNIFMRLQQILFFVAIAWKMFPCPRSLRKRLEKIPCFDKGNYSTGHCEIQNRLFNFKIQKKVIFLLEDSIKYFITYSRLGYVFIYFLYIIYRKDFVFVYIYRNDVGNIYRNVGKIGNIYRKYKT